MDIPPLVLPGAVAQPPPQVAADLRPAADAAALVRDPRPAVAAASVLPAPLAQLAEVSRSLVAVAAEEGPPAVRQAQRVLKPWGVTMLPATDDDHPRRAATATGRRVTPD
ncbi:MAG: hypothetical protein H3C51_04590 [Rubellimicrobium sp.]|nr:hypothetical protein [Rubellimicrobium sp.]